MELCTSKKNMRREFICKSVEIVIEELATNGIYPSRRKIEECLPKGIILKEHSVKKIWKYKINKINLEN